MNDGNAIIAEILITLGGLFLLGLLADIASRHTPLPRVTLLLLVGLIIGPSALDWLPEFANRLFPILTDIALAMIAFLLGGRLTRSSLAELGRSVLGISVGIVLATAVLVAGVLIAAGIRVELALLLGAIATSTAPAATADVVYQLGAKGKFTDTLLQIVAIDDAWGLLIFTLSLAAAHAVLGHGGAFEYFVLGIREVGAALLLGGALGIPMAYLTGRIRPGEPTLVEALGIVLLAAGLAELLGVSYLLTAMALGAVVANLARHHEYPFHAIEGIEWPFLILFFLLAGASLQLEALSGVGWLAVAYIVLRIIGRYVGTQIGGRLGKTPPQIRRWIGLALLPQAGVAVGMALLAAQQFPDLRDSIVTVVLTSVVVFELLGPVATRWTLERVGEAAATQR